MVWYIPPAAVAFPSVTLLKVLAGPARFNLAEGTLKTLTVNKNKERVVFFKRLQLHLLIGFTHSNPHHPPPATPLSGQDPQPRCSQLEQLFGLESSREQKANDQSGGFIGFMRYPWLAERIRHQKVEQQGWARDRSGGRGHGPRPARNAGTEGGGGGGGAGECARFSWLQQTLNALQSIKRKFVTGPG